MRLPWKPGPYQEATPTCTPFVIGGGAGARTAAQPAAPTSQSATHPRVPPRIPAHYRRPDRVRNTAFSLAFVIYSPWGLW